MDKQDVIEIADGLKMIEDGVRKNSKRHARKEN